MKRATIKRFARTKLPSLPLDSLKTAVLGLNYELSIVSVGVSRSLHINYRYRNRRRATNVLSFALASDCGELVLCPILIREESRRLKISFRDYFSYLAVHGMLHLKGLDHGSKMESLETQFLMPIVSKQMTNWLRA